MFGPFVSWEAQRLYIESSDHLRILGSICATWCGVGTSWMKVAASTNMHTGEVAMAVNPSMEERDIEMLNRIP
jgi:hypothetical protein